MWNTQIYTSPQQNIQTEIRYLKDINSTHWVALYDLLKALGYASTSLESGLMSLARPIPKQFRQVVYADRSGSSENSKRINPILVLNYSGCNWFLERSTKGDPESLADWLNTNIFTGTEIKKQEKGYQENPASQDTSLSGNLLDHTLKCQYNGHRIRIVLISTIPYFYVADIAEVIDYGNLRYLIVKKIDAEYKATIYRGNRPATLLTSKGVDQLLSYIASTCQESRVDEVKAVKEWILDSVIPALEEDKELPPDPFANKAKPKGKKLEVNQDVTVDFESCQAIVKTYAYSDNKTLQVLLLGDIAYFLTASLAELTGLTVDDINKKIPAIWRTYQTIQETASVTAPDGTCKSYTSKYVRSCLTDTGVYALVEQTGNLVLLEWFKNIVIPNLRSDGYVPSNLYDFDADDLTEKEMSINNSTIDYVATVKPTDQSNKYICLFDGVEIPILCKDKKVWFALSPIEAVLGFPNYIVTSYPLKGINFSVVLREQVQKLNSSGKACWQPYYIEYEGLKSFLVSCEKPLAESFYMSLEEDVIPYIHSMLNQNKEGENEVATKQAEVKPPIQESEPAKAKAKADVDVEKLLSDPDSLIRILKAYKEVKESKADLTAENEALREYIRVNQSKVDFAEALAHHMDSEETNEFIKKLADNIIEGGAQKLKEWLVELVKNGDIVKE